MEAQGGKRVLYEDQYCSLVMRLGFCLPSDRHLDLHQVLRPENKTRMSLRSQQSSARYHKYVAVRNAGVTVILAFKWMEMIYARVRRNLQNDKVCTTFILKFVHSLHKPLSGVLPYPAAGTNMRLLLARDQEQREPNIAAIFLFRDPTDETEAGT